MIILLGRHGHQLPTQQLDLSVLDYTGSLHGVHIGHSEAVARSIGASRPVVA